MNVGFDSASSTWEFIVKYHDTLDMLIPTGISVEYLIAGYAILTVPEKQAESLSAVETIEYIEKLSHQVVMPKPVKGGVPLWQGKVERRPVLLYA